jgi:2-methylaconitate cis-trans-isomerase PrpF
MKIPCAIYRGGTSKPIFFMENDLPKDPNVTRAALARAARLLIRASLAHVRV